MTKKTTKKKASAKKKTRRAWTAAERAAFAKKMRAAREAAAEDRSNQRGEVHGISMRGLKTAATKKPSAKKNAPAKKSKWWVVRLAGRAADTHAGRTLDEALDLANPDQGDKIEVFRVTAADAGAARLARLQKPADVYRFGEPPKLIDGFTRIDGPRGPVYAATIHVSDRNKTREWPIRIIGDDGRWNVDRNEMGIWEPLDGKRFDGFEAPQQAAAAIAEAYGSIFPWPTRSNPPIDPHAWTREPADRLQYAKGVRDGTKDARPKNPAARYRKTLAAGRTGNYFDGYMDGKSQRNPPRAAPTRGTAVAAIAAMTRDKDPMVAAAARNMIAKIEADPSLAHKVNQDSAAHWRAKVRKIGRSVASQLDAAKAVGRHKAAKKNAPAKVTPAKRVQSISVYLDNNAVAHVTVFTRNFREHAWTFQGNENMSWAAAIREVKRELDAKGLHYAQAISRQSYWTPIARGWRYPRIPA